MRQKRAGSVEIKIQLPCQTHNMRRFEGVVSLQHTQIWSRAPKTIRTTTLRNQHTIARIVLGISITRESLATSELQARCVCVRTVAGQYVKHGAAVKKSMPYNWKKKLTHTQTQTKTAMSQHVSQRNCTQKELWLCSSDESSNATLMSRQQLCVFTSCKKMD